MYYLETALKHVAGVGPKIKVLLAAEQLETVQDLLLRVPFRYEDRSLRKTIDQLEVGETVTLEATVEKTSQFRAGKRMIQTAIIRDATSKTKLMWFNNKFILAQLKAGESYLFSGSLNDRGTIIQPTVEKVSSDTTHTGRLVPIYSQLSKIAPGTVRRLLKKITDELEIEDHLPPSRKNSFSDLATTFKQLHFPDSEETARAGRERLAFEELVSVINQSHHLKEKWNQLGSAATLKLHPKTPQLPFQLTTAQERSLAEILSDLQSSIPMNRLMVGDVGSGKTIVAGLAAYQLLAEGHNVVITAPTQILASQHLETIQTFFPKMSLQLITGTSKKTIYPSTPTLYIGTHAVLNRLDKIKPALIVYDEQHRYGVSQRSEAQTLEKPPHLLTMTATPIPRSMMLTLFSHLELSTIDELPPGRIPTKTWIVPHKKRLDSYDWILKQHQINPDTQTIIVCPFIEESDAPQLKDVAAVSTKFEQITTIFKKSQLRIAQLHGRLPQKEKEAVAAGLRNKELDIVVTTSVVEVGLDLPTASIIIIEGAERFGLASLHQLRGRVGRAGQQGFCLLFTTTTTRHDRLTTFSKENNGLKLAELDLQRRGGGDLFGVDQSGFEFLQFAEWGNSDLIAAARTAFTEGYRSQVFEHGGGEVLGN